MLALLSMLMIPAPPSLDIRGWSETNPVNGNAWTLYFEYLANILYALIIRRFPKWLLSIFVLMSAVLTLDLTLNLDLFGLLDGRTVEAYTVIGGWSMEKQSLYIGFARLLFPFFGGLLLSRFVNGRGFGAGLRPSHSFALAALLLALVLVMPRLGGEHQPVLNGIYEAFSILVAFPLIVSIGAFGGRLSGKSLSFCKWLGDISYPLYITHYALIFGVVNPWRANHPQAAFGQLLVLSAGSVALSVFVAHAAFKLYDEPVRNWLKSRF